MAKEFGGGGGGHATSPKSAKVLPKSAKDVRVVPKPLSLTISTKAPTITIVSTATATAPEPVQTLRGFSMNVKFFRDADGARINLIDRSQFEEAVDAASNVKREFDAARRRK